MEAGFPVRADVDYQDEYNRFLPIVKWLLLVPHYIVLLLLGLAAYLVTVVAAFAVLFTRRYPRGIYAFVLGVLRWTLRVSAYGYLMTDRYPPFRLADDPGYPARLQIDYPGEMERWRPFVAWLLGIPYLIVAGIIQQVAQILVLFAFFVILFTKRFPKGMFEIVTVSLRWQMRAYAYAGFLVTRYPPFVWG